jgi:hypothetical protein
MRLLADEADMLLWANGLFLRGVKVGVKATGDWGWYVGSREKHSSEPSSTSLLAAWGSEQESSLAGKE